ncbi:MAG: hypothetical protein WCS65_12430 [Verrucomicrobiae bacterium]
MREQLDSMKAIKGYENLITDTDTAVIEAFSDVAVNVFLGRTKDAEVPAGLRAFLRQLKVLGREIIYQVFHLKRAIADGQVDKNWHEFLARSVGLDLDRQIAIEGAKSVRQMESDALGELRSGDYAQGDEILDVLRNAPGNGKLPSKGSKYWDSWSGELQSLQDAVKALGRGNYKDQKGMLISDIFSKDAMDPDMLLTAFNENGFDFFTVDDMFQALQERFSSGKPMHGYKSNDAMQGEHYSVGKALLAPNGKPSNLTPELHALFRTPAFKAGFGDWEGLAIQKHFSDFVDKALDDPLSKEGFRYRDFDRQEIEAARKLVGMDATGLFHEISQQELRHALNRHSDVLTKEDLKRIPEVLDSWDFIEAGTPKKGFKSLRYGKDIGDGTLVYVERLFPTSRKKSPRATTITAWKENRQSIRSAAGSRMRYARSAETAQTQHALSNGKVNPDSVSKAVDENGEPLPIYHGSPDIRGIVEDGFKGSSRGEVFFGSDSFAVADTYADDKRALDYQNAEPQTLPLAVRILNPMIVDAGGKHWRETEKYVSEAKEKGHDGIIIKNSLDEYSNKAGGKISTVFAWFESNQAKSIISGQLNSRVDGKPIKGATANRGTFDPADPRINYSVIKAESARYLDLAKNPEKNRDELQRMVNDAAQKSAYAVGPVGHGSGARFDTFKREFAGSTTEAKSAAEAFFFSDGERTPKAYAVYAAEEGPIKDLMRRADHAEKRGDWDEYERLIIQAEEMSFGEAGYDATLKRRENAVVYNVFLRGRFMEMDADGMTPDELSRAKQFKEFDGSITAAIKEAKRLGYDGLKITNFDDAPNVVEPSTHYAVFNSNQIKLSDPVTYDANGKVIPLEQRFNPDSENINYSTIRKEALEPETVQKELDARMRNPTVRLAVYERAKAMFEAERARRGDAIDPNRKFESLRQSMAELNAILSVLPPEIRGKVGGMMTLANLGNPHPLAKIVRDLVIRDRADEPLKSFMVEVVGIRSFEELFQRAFFSPASGIGCRAERINPLLDKRPMPVNPCLFLDPPCLAARLERGLEEVMGGREGFRIQRVEITERVQCAPFLSELRGIFRPGRLESVFDCCHAGRCRISIKKGRPPDGVCECLGFRTEC